MSEKPWEEMSQDAKLDWLRARYEQLREFVNSEVQLRGIKRRLDVLDRALKRAASDTQERDE